MIEGFCKLALIAITAFNVFIALKAQGRLIGYFVTKYREGDPPQVLAGEWRRFDAWPTLLNSLLYMLLLWGAGVFS